MQRITTSNLPKEGTSIKMYLVENESNPVGLLSVGLTQCSGRVKLSLNNRMHYRMFVHTTTPLFLFIFGKWHLCTLDDN